MDNKIKLKAFLENTKRLNKRFGITPLLYGSLGLEYVTGEDFSADDIDILIPEYHLLEGWSKFRRYLETVGYVMVDEHEHTFEKDGISFSYARLEELEAFAGIKISDIATDSTENIRFMILSPEQYLAVYKASAKDGYRLNVKEKKDNEKIGRISNYIKKQKESLSRMRFGVKGFCKMTPFMNVATALFLFSLIFVTVLSYLWKGYDVAAIFTVILLVAFVALGFFFNYGLSVSKKYVTVIYYNELRIFRYDDVTKIELWIDDDMIVGSVKAIGEKEYDFCFSDFNIGRVHEPFPTLFDVKVRVSQKKADKILSDSAVCDKIKVHLKKG